MINFDFGTAVECDAKLGQVVNFVMICWTPEHFLNVAKYKDAVRYAVIILNRPINGDRGMVESLWRHGEKRRGFFFCNSAIFLSRQALERLLTFVVSGIFSQDPGDSRWGD